MMYMNMEWSICMIKTGEIGLLGWIMVILG